MSKIIKILGPSGAGKTTVVRQLMLGLQVGNAYASVGLVAKPSKVIGHGFRHPGVDKPIYVVGKYDTTGCGGVDTIDSAQKVMDDIDDWHKTHHIVYEGLLQSTYYGAMGKWSKQYGDDFIYLWLNTPLEVCMERLHARRAANGTKRPLNEQQARDKWETVKRAWERARTEGHCAEILDWELPSTPQILELLK